VRQLASRNADLPEKRAEQKALVQAVVASAPTNPVVLTSKPGFRGGDGSTTGKTLVAMAAAGACGSPNALIDWDTTMRGVSEACASRNDLVLVLDDTEKFPGDERELRKMVHALVQKIPGGRSRTIAKKAQAGGLPPLTWSTFGLSTSTRAEPDSRQRQNRAWFIKPSPMASGANPTGALPCVAPMMMNRNIMVRTTSARNPENRLYLPGECSP
jgi:hypothetical protein